VIGSGSLSNVMQYSLLTRLFGVARCWSKRTGAVGFHQLLEAVPQL